MKTTRRIILKTLTIVLSLFLGVTTYLLIQEAYKRSRFRLEYPPPGRMVQLTAHRLHLHCIGKGKPTVIFESDIDQYGSLSWDSVQYRIADHTRACSYDRAGIMWSEPGPLPRDGLRIAAELEATLETAKEHGPYVLVGHAFGGVYTRIFAGQHLDTVCGMVLVDAAHPEMLKRFSEFGIGQALPAEQLRPLVAFLSRLGMPGRFKGNVYNLASDVYAPQQAFLPLSSMAWFDETVEGRAALAQAGQYENFGGLPLIVLASARPSIQIKGRDMQQAWLTLQRELTQLSTAGEIELLGSSGHYIQFDQPQKVIEAVLDIVLRCNKESRGNSVSW